MEENEVIPSKGRKKEVSEKIYIHKVRLVSKDKRYSRIPYLFTVAQSVSSGKFITGQEDILSIDQMMGKNEPKITNEQKRNLQMGPYPYIINPENTYPCKSLRTFDLSYKMVGPDPEDREYLVPKDWAEFNFFIRQKDAVASSKAEYQKNRHFFYVEDQEKEAGEELLMLDKRFEAETFVRTKLASDRYKEIILMLNFSVPGFNMDPKVMSNTQMMTTIFKACQDHPDTVLKLAAKDAPQLLFVLKLMYHKIIERRNNTDFYAGETFVGTTLDAVKMWCNRPENTQLVTKWGAIIESKEK